METTQKSRSPDPRRRRRTPGSRRPAPRRSVSPPEVTTDTTHFLLSVSFSSPFPYRSDLHSHLESMLFLSNSCQLSWKAFPPISGCLFHQTLDVGSRPKSDN